MKNSIVRSMALGVVTLGLLGAMGGPATAGLLWYNGDFNGVNGLANEINTAVTQSNVYDNFNVTAASGWTINSVFSNDLMSFTGVTSAEWEIRTGVSKGVGGTVIASGTSAATQVATGRNAFGFNEYTIMVSGLSVQLAQGTHWLTVAPVGTGSGSAFDSTTSGLNAVGTPPGNDNNSYWNSSYYNESFGPATDGLGGSSADFSMGVNGTITGSVVPEPSSIALVSCAGLMGLGFRWWTRRRAA